MSALVRECNCRTKVKKIHKIIIFQICLSKDYFSYFISYSVSEVKERSQVNKNFAQLFKVFVWGLGK